MAQAHQTTSERIGIPLEEQRLDVGGQWIMRDYNQVTRGKKRFEIATYMTKLKVVSNGHRTVALVTTGDSLSLDAWRMVESDDPAVAAFIDQLIAVSMEESS